MSRRSTMDARDGALPPSHISTSNLQHATSPPHLQHTPGGTNSSALPTPSRTPSLPLVVIKAQKPSSIQEIRDQALLTTRDVHTTATATTTTTAAAATSAATPGSRRSASISSDNNQHPQQHLPLHDDIPPSIASSMAALAATSSSPSNADRMSSPSSPLPPLAAIQTRTIHPQVHYVFADDDPQASSLLSQLPKQRTISLHLDPATGLITNVDSFIPEFQITSIQAVPVPSPNTPSSAFQTSSSSASLSTGGATTAVNATSPPSPAPIPTSTTQAQGLSSSSHSSSSLNTHHNQSSSTILAQTKAARGQVATITSGPSSTGTTTSGSSSSSVTGGGTSAVSKQVGQSEPSSVAEPPPTAQPQQPVYRDWTLVIEGVETDTHPERGRPGYFYDKASGNELQFLEDSALLSPTLKRGAGGDVLSATLTGGAGSASDGTDGLGGSGGRDAPSRFPEPTAVGFHTETDLETHQVNLVLNDDYLDDCDAILASFGARNKLLKKVLEFNTSQTSSQPVVSSIAAPEVSGAKLNSRDDAE
ncbi:hypothetical protein BGW42_005583 [Actinomortierella wolfii]|nr:hypothetical protein BGW42_005583 [Actinomortierella wolfii]